ncbi:MAG: hypothetical protein JWN30_447, partial [Bacilli bacterium]|nr:hypothetical protein [Bacilli bacterium]
QSMTAGPFSVTDKKTLPPSGDKHDYISMGPYWWPNPETDNGLPYIRRDGQTYPGSRTNDKTDMGKMRSNVETLALAYFLSGQERYAEHAANLLKVWFLNLDTKMNPNLNYGQGIPGICEGRGIGIIDTTGLVHLVEAVELMRDSHAWTDNDHQQLQTWFRQYLHWLLDSQHGKDENAAQNNHGSSYAMQVTVFALFAGEREQAEQTVASSLPYRIKLQIEPDGRQPLELERTAALGYSSMNLSILFHMAQVAHQLGHDFWHYETEDGRSLKKALDWLIPFMTGDQPFPYQQIREQSPVVFFQLLRQAAVVYNNDKYEQITSKLSGLQLDEQRIQLLYPLV